MKTITRLILAMAVVLTVVTPKLAQAFDFALPPLNGTFNIDFAYQGQYTSGQLKYNGDGTVFGAQQTVTSPSGSVCQENTAGTYTYQYRQITITGPGVPNGTFYALDGTTHLTVTPEAPAFNCPASRATSLALYFRGTVGVDCDSTTYPPTSPYYCNEYVILTQGSTATNGSHNYPIIGSMILPDTETTGTTDMLIGYFNPITYGFTPGYWINRSYSPFVATAPELCVDPSMVLVVGRNAIGGDLQAIPTTAYSAATQCNPSVFDTSNLGINAMPAGDTSSIGF